MNIIYFFIGLLILGIIGLIIDFIINNWIICLLILIIITGIFIITFILKRRKTTTKNKYTYNEQNLKFFDNNEHRIKELTKNNIEKTEKNFYNEQLEKCTNCEKVYYKTLYKKYSDKYTIKSQIYLRSIFPKMGAENLRIDIVFFEKNTNTPILLIEINEKSHNDLLRKNRDRILKEFCKQNKIKLQFLYSKFGCVPKSIYKVIDNILKE